MESANGRQKTRNHGYDVIVGGELFTDYSDHPRKLVIIKPKTQQQAPDATSFPVGGMPTALTWKTSLRKVRTCRCGIAVIAERGALPYDWSWWYPSGNWPLQQYLGFPLPGAGYGQFEHKADSLIAKFKEAGGTVRKRFTRAECTAIISALVICIIVCLSWAVNHYRDNAITYKAQRDKNARELKLANAAITGDVQMRQRDVAAWCKIHEELADAGAENDALRDDVAGRRRLHIKKQSVSQCVKPNYRLRRG